MSWREQIKPLLALIQEKINDNEGSDEAAAVVGVCVAVVAAGGPPKKKQRGGSIPGRSPNIDRGRAAADQLLYTDYFAPIPLFPEALFRRRFRMSRRLFARVVEQVTAADSYFVQRPDALGVLGFSPRQKVTAAMRMLCYGICADATDEYVRIADSTALESLKHFGKAVIKCFGEEYLREPTPADIARHAALNASRGFPGMFGSLDCTHWQWKNCPTAWHSMYQDRDGNVTMIMETIATKDLWIWHSFVGVPGSNNDINVVDRSPLIVNWLKGNAPSYEFKVNEKTRSMCYLLCDGIYPDWSVFVKSIRQPETAKEKHYAGGHESVRKDVERCFGVLKCRFGILSQPARLWDEEMLRIVWRCCVALHNMIIEDERDDMEDAYIHPIDSPSAAQTTLPFDELLAGISRIQNRAAHATLQHDLIEHNWNIC